MARPKRPKSANDHAVEIPPQMSIGIGGAGEAETTGRFIIIFKDEAVGDPAMVKATLGRVAGIREIASAADYAEGAFSADDLADAETLHFPQLGIVVVGGDDARVQALTASSMDSDSAILAIEPEYVAHALGGAGGTPLDYLRGYRDAVNHLYDELSGRGTSDDHGADEQAAFQDTAQLTWGLQATRVDTSRYSGQGVRLAVLDTGFDLQHPDFQGRPVVSQSFIQGQVVQDGNGHGTHCIGTSCGAQRPIGTRRYGIAYGAQIHVGKVLSNQGSGATGGIVAGIEWAITRGCQVVSMSLGANIDQKIQQYEVPIRRALAAGTLIVAAAGNNANRSAGVFGFVGPPANADAAMAVAAVDSQLRIANFSARSSMVTGDGGKVNIAGPGVAVYSSWPMATRYNTISGTSMATPHVAGIAALWCQATGATGAALWTRITQAARALGASSSDVGSGLVQAPQ